MTVPSGYRGALAVALTTARHARLEITAALERLAAAGPGAWEGRQADRWHQRMRRFAAEATELADRCVHACEEAWSSPSPSPGPSGATGPSARPTG